MSTRRGGGTSKRYKAVAVLLTLRNITVLLQQRNGGTILENKDYRLS